MKRTLKFIAKGELDPLEMEHILLFVTGVFILFFAQQHYHHMELVPQVIILVVYLGLLLGIAPVKMRRCKSNFGQTVFAGLVSGVFDSFIVLLQAKDIKVKMKDSVNIDEETINNQRMHLLAIITISALIGGLVIWFGEVYAAPLYKMEKRIGLLSAIYIVPPIILFLCILGLHSERLQIKVDKDSGEKSTKRDLVEFAIGIFLLLWFHNALLCLSILLIYSVLTRQDNLLLDAWKHHTEINVMLVLLLAWIGGTQIKEFATFCQLDTGYIGPITMSAIQAVLWSPLYISSDLSFWHKLTNLAVGALILPTSSLVGIMLFHRLKDWLLYMKYSIIYAILFFCIMHGWFYITMDTDFYKWTEKVSIQKIQKK